MGAFAAIQNEGVPTFYMPEENLPSFNLPPNLSYNISPPQEVPAPQQEGTGSTFGSFSKNKPSQFSTVEVDDGKSSLDFFKKLN